MQWSIACSGVSLLTTCPHVNWTTLLPFEFGLLQQCFGLNSKHPSLGQVLLFCYRWMKKKKITLQVVQEILLRVLLSSDSAVLLAIHTLRWCVHVVMGLSHVYACTGLAVHIQNSDCSYVCAISHTHCPDSDIHTDQ